MTSSLDLTQFPGLPRDERDHAIAISPRVADLAASFPLLFFMLASDCGAFARRLEVIKLIEQGRPLADLAAAYRLPLCFRRVPPQACVVPLPWIGWSNRAD